jgi:serine/threonine protein phosphatase PrpC
MSTADLDATLLLGRDLSEPERIRLSVGQVVVQTTRCPDKHSPNEDAAAIIPVPDGAVLVVADGMGGGPAGQKASSLAVRILAEQLRHIDATLEQQLRFAILNGIEQANASIQQLGIGAATTLAVVEVRNEFVRPYHVGDSLILVVGTRGKLKLQTVPHSPVGYGVEAGLLDGVEAMHHADRHVVSNVVGDPDMRIEIGPPLRLAARDTLVVASDGLADNLHTEEIAEWVRKGDLFNASQRLFNEALRRMSGQADQHPSKPDDLTLIAFRRHARPPGRLAKRAARADSQAGGPATPK